MVTMEGLAPSVIPAPKAGAMATRRHHDKNLILVWGGDNPHLSFEYPIGVLPLHVGTPKPKISKNGETFRL